MKQFTSQTNDISKTTGAALSPGQNLVKQLVTWLKRVPGQSDDSRYKNLDEEQLGHYLNAIAKQHKQSSGLDTNYKGRIKAWSEGTRPISPFDANILYAFILCWNAAQAGWNQAPIDTLEIALQKLHLAYHPSIIPGGFNTSDNLSPFAINPRCFEPRLLTLNSLNIDHPQPDHPPAGGQFTKLAKLKKRPSSTEISANKVIELIIKVGGKNGFKSGLKYFKENAADADTLDYLEDLNTYHHKKGEAPDLPDDVRTELTDIYQNWRTSPTHIAAAGKAAWGGRKK